MKLFDSFILQVAEGSGSSRLVKFLFPNLLVYYFLIRLPSAKMSICLKGEK